MSYKQGDEFLLETALRKGRPHTEPELLKIQNTEANFGPPIPDDKPIIYRKTRSCGPSEFPLGVEVKPDESRFSVLLRRDLPEHASHGGVYKRAVTSPLLEAFCFCGVALSLSPLTDAVVKIDEKATERFSATAKIAGMTAAEAISALHARRSRAMFQVIPHESIPKGEVYLTSHNSKGDVVDVVRAVNLDKEEQKS